MKFLAVFPGLEFLKIDQKSSEFQLSLLHPLAPFESPQQGPNPGQQFVATEWFHQKIVSSDIESVNSILNFSARRQDQDRHRFREPPQFLAKGKTVQFRHHDIEQDQIWFLLNGLRQADFSVLRQENAVTFSSQRV